MLEYGNILELNIYLFRKCKSKPGGQSQTLADEFQAFVVEGFYVPAH